MLSLSWIKRRRSTVEQQEINGLCNEAILTWVGPGQSDEALAMFLTRIDRHHRKDVERQARALLQAFERLLPRSNSGTPVEGIASSVERQLRVKFPWMSSEAFSRLDSYGRWMTWHG
jgi:hypothetical protein